MKMKMKATKKYLKRREKDGDAENSLPKRSTKEKTKRRE